MKSLCVSGKDIMEDYGDGEDISWSSSDSESDISSHARYQPPTTKIFLRVRKPRKKSAKSLKHLDVTVIPVITPVREEKNTSPVLGQQLKDRPSSPVLTPFNSTKGTRNTARTFNFSLEAADMQGNNENDRPPSPILSCKSLTKNAKEYQHDDLWCKKRTVRDISGGITSPYSKQTFASKPPSSPELKLLYSSSKKSKNWSETLLKVHELDHRENNLQDTSIHCSDRFTPPIATIKQCCNVSCPMSNVSSCRRKFRTPIDKTLNSPTANEEPAVKSDSNGQLSPILSTKRAQPDFRSPPIKAMSKKIKSYFDSHFSSQSISQGSINDSTSQSQIPASQVDVTDSGNQKTHDTPIKIDEYSSPAPSQYSSNKILSVSSGKTSPTKPSISDGSSTSKVSVLIKTESEEVLQTKRRRHKKDGLASRLQALLKKQRNQLSLWQHEMYLASNSNFVVPSSSPYRLFGIEKINHKYGSYLIEAVDLADKLDYLVLLSLNFECNMVVTEKSVLKLYEPYELIESDSKRYIVRACKFECLNIKDEESE